MTASINLPLKIQRRIFYSIPLLYMLYYSIRCNNSKDGYCFKKYSQSKSSLSRYTMHIYGFGEIAPPVCCIEPRLFAYLNRPLKSQAQWERALCAYLDLPHWKYAWMDVQDSQCEVLLSVFGNTETIRNAVKQASSWK